MQTHPPTMNAAPSTILMQVVSTFRFLDSFFATVLMSRWTHKCDLGVHQNGNGVNNYNSYGLTNHRCGHSQSDPWTINISCTRTA
mmetsp:Transcript_35337/g.63145  ORF Transcript_35337/g.63145 Transcript_35337/m.63145 type:complete len:85 (+) Transcript_35337:610-864(+)